MGHKQGTQMVKNLVAVAAFICSSAYARETRPLSAAETDQALQIEQRAVRLDSSRFIDYPEIRDAANKVTSGPQYITGVSAMPAKVADEPRIAQVTRYIYAGGITVHTYVDLDSGKALSVNPYVNFPTPLSREEVERAKRLALEHIPEVSAVGDGDDIEVDALTMIVSSKSRPDYGHRLAILNFRTKEGAPLTIPPVHVNLTEGLARVYR